MASNPKTTSPIEFSSLSKGFITDSSPLNYQPDSASELENFNLNLNGSIQRRNGLVKLLPIFAGNFPYEDNYLTSLVSDLPTDYYDFYKGKMGSYLWTGAGETANSTILVISNADGRVNFFLVESGGLTQIPVDSGNFMLNLDFNGLPTSTPYNKLDFTISGTKLLICNGGFFIYSMEYKGGVIEHTSGRLTVRDQWGIYDTNIGGVDLTGAGSKIRPHIDYTASTAELEVLQRHIYNLMNQGWADMITPLGSQALDIPSSNFKAKSFAEYGATKDFWPSNADSPIDFTYPDTSDTANPTIDRYHAFDHVQSVVGNGRAPQGHYIIDLVSRSASRRQNYLDTAQVYVDRGKTLAPPWQTAPEDIDYNTYGGPSAIASFAGRVWYSGITNAGIVNDWDGAPDLSKLVLFSQLADSDSASLRCYQSGDPTSADNPDIVDTDGGFIVLPEAEVIMKLVPIGDTLVVIASNGVWAIDGGEGGFTATGYRVNKVSSSGCIAAGSVVEVEDSVLYFSQRGIMQVAGTSLDGMVATDISKGRITNYYHTLTPNELITCTAAYNPEEGEVSWNMLGTTQATELKLSLDLNAFFKHVWQGSLMGGAVLPVATVPLPKVLAGILENLVVVNGTEVLAGGESVSVDSKTNTGGAVSYIKVIQQISPHPTNNIEYLNLGFAVSDPSTFNDWESFPVNIGGGAQNRWVVPSPVDSPGTIVTGYLTGGDTQRSKQASYLTMLFNKTETGFGEDPLTSELGPIGVSSCRVQAQWEWTNSAKSNRWGKEFQAYRHRRLYMPEDGADQYEDGNSVVTTKSKLRGKGRALSLKMTTEPDLDCQILGWSFNLSMGNAV